MSKAFHEWLAQCPVNWLRLKVGKDFTEYAFENDEEELPFEDFLAKHNYPNGNWSIKEKPKDCWEFQDIVHEAYGNGSLAGKQGDYCCVVSLKEGRIASVSLEWDDIKKVNGGIEREYYLGITEMVE
jgi:hypothetical protein